MNKLRTGDEVLVIAGKDKGKKGIVSAMAGRDRVVVEGVNISKKHQKTIPKMNQIWSPNRVPKWSQNRPK